MRTLNNSNRVVITGLGVVAANGIGIEQFWRSLIERDSGIGLITLFDAEKLKSRIAGEVTNFDVNDFLSEKLNSKRTARHTQLALAATMLALDDAGCRDLRMPQSSSVPLVIGVTTVAHDLFNPGLVRTFEGGPAHAPPHLVRDAIPHAITTTIAKYLKFETWSKTLSNGCPSGVDAVYRAAELIRDGSADLAIAGGTDAPIAPLAFGCFINAGLSSCRNSDPAAASRPFDRDRDSGVVAEGAGILILENMEHALARKAEIYAEITGYGTADYGDGENPLFSMEEAMKSALTNACRRPENVDYICAHGPGHPDLDRIETAVIKQVFKDKAYSVPVSSIKGVTGNPLAAAGPMQIIASSLAVKNSILPPTANYEIPDPLCDLDYIVEGPRTADVSCVLVNSHGVSGNSSCIVIEKVKLNALIPSA